MAAKDTAEDEITESDWLFEYIDSVMKSPAWDSEVMTFVDDNCVIFDNEEENKFEYTVVHEKFAEMLEGLMTKHLKEVAITPEQFAEACEKARYASRGNKKIFEQIISLTDFLTFKKLMVKRNMELELEAVRELQQQAIPIVAPVDEEEAEKLFQMALKESAEMSVNEAQKILEKAREEAENSKVADPEDGQNGVESDIEIRKAMDLNLMELELQNRQFEMEQQELEQALAMSLFMEQERLRIAQEEQEEFEEEDDDEEESYEEIGQVVSSVTPLKAEVKQQSPIAVVSPAASTRSAKDVEEEAVAGDKASSSSSQDKTSDQPVSSLSAAAPTESPSQFEAASLRAAPKLTGSTPIVSESLSAKQSVTDMSASNSFPAEQQPTIVPVEKKKKKKKKKDKNRERGGQDTLGPLSAPKNLAPLPSIEELQKQMQKRRSEAEEAFRRNQEALTQQKQTEKELTSAAGVTSEDAGRRAAYLKKQRDKLVAKKRAERESKAKAYEDEKEQGLASMMAEAQQAAVQTGGAEAKDSSVADQESEERRNMMRIALARRMKRDLLVSESERLRSMQEDQYADLDKQLRMVEGLREENRVREKELGDQIKRQQEQRFKNLQNSVATQVLEHS
jgi:hypothetical protein